MDIFNAGIDVSKDRLDVCVLPANDVFHVTRDAPGLDESIKRLRQGRRSVLEHHSQPFS